MGVTTGITLAVLAVVLLAISLRTPPEILTSSTKNFPSRILLKNIQGNLAGILPEVSPASPVISRKNSFISFL